MPAKHLCSFMTVLFLSCLVASNANVSKTNSTNSRSRNLPTEHSSISTNQTTKEVEAIGKTLIDYIEGSTGGQPKRLQKAFHSELNLYSVREDKLRIWTGKDYISSTKEGKPTGEKGKVLSIDFENDIAVAKVEIVPPQGAKFVDYFMLAKFEGKWTIIHKMFTRSNGNRGIWQANKLESNKDHHKTPVTTTDSPHSF